MGKRIAALTDEQVDKLINDFYSYFQNGYEFEDFLKVYLEKLGLDEVLVTQRSRDGGIDLKAIRNGVGGFSEVDTVEYYVQAKRNKPNTTVSVTKVRELKGTIPFGHKGIFITTAKFSSDAKIEAENDPSKPVILIDGKALIESCIDYELGFVFMPVFSKSAMDSLRDLTESIPTESSGDVADEREILTIDKFISTNDIRARILRIPKAIVDLLSPEEKKVKVSFNGLPVRELTIAKSRNYLAGVTEIYRESKLIAEDGSYKPCKTVWKYSEEKIDIILKE